MSSFAVQQLAEVAFEAEHSGPNAGGHFDQGEISDTHAEQPFEQPGEITNAPPTEVRSTGTTYCFPAATAEQAASRLWEGGSVPSTLLEKCDLDVADASSITPELFRSTYVLTGVEGQPLRAQEAMRTKCKDCGICQQHLSNTDHQAEKRCCHGRALASAYGLRMRQPRPMQHTHNHLAPPGSMYTT